MMSKTETAKRYGLFIVSLFFIALGIAFTKGSGLGVSPISSVANVMNCRFPEISMGMWLFIWNCIMVLGQIILLRKKIQPIQLLQIPLSFVFGWFNDLGMWIISGLSPEMYLFRIGMLFIGIIILGFGIALSVIADVIMNAGDAFVKVLSDVLDINFGKVKIAVDVFCVTLSLILSLIFFDLRIVGTREGTVISAFMTGNFVNVFVKILRKPVGNIVADKA